jgi:uncharacterized protein YbjT (DUF2867 family)
MTGDGIRAATEGVQTVVHLAGSARDDDVKAANLISAAEETGVERVVFISVVGADRVPIRYFRAKHRAEQIITTSQLAWTTLRATQFHQLLGNVVSKLVKMPVVPVPTVRFQPVDAAEVAERLVDLTLRPPAGLVDDVAGPEVLTMKELVATYLRARDRHRLLVPVRVPGRGGRAFRAGANLAPDCAVGGRTWEQFIAAGRQRRPAEPRPVERAS